MKITLFIHLFNELVIDQYLGNTFPVSMYGIRKQSENAQTAHAG